MPLLGRSIEQIARMVAVILLTAGTMGGGVIAVDAQGSADQAPGLEQARRRAAEIDQLFEKLRAATDQVDADATTARIWDVWMQSGRDDVDVLISRAVANMAARHFGLARLLLDEVVELTPSFAEAWNKRATLFYHMGQYASALSDIATTLTLEPRHFGALAGRAAIYADTNRWPEALEAYRAALAVNPFLASRDKVLPELERRAGDGKL